ncbi:hypothetical protein M422DRAFT_32294 [Sphaerobolus stellatus SS14]|uniref:NmrA-like domain-containing protein n=1 Tax=Sphaerobolus stellatus (strain SS14) TaxID=990650 RepID=A0A0C9VPW2_SPHS4|nr:hypothetical protein M422DRAFT_32294 [Sphaerobolus stellatus SS14]
MSAYKSFAIAGFGKAGSLYANCFAQHKEDGFKWKVLSRSFAKPELRTAEAQGAELVAVDYDSQSSLINALKGVDVVLSTLRDEGLETVQLNLVRAAKEAGVKLFVPSEYGKNTLGIKEPYLKPKADTHDLLKELNLPYTLFFTGLWPSLILEPVSGILMGMDFDAGKFNFFGDGKIGLSWTTPEDFVPLAHHILTTLPLSELENSVFQIEGDRKSLKEIVALWQKKTGRKPEIYERSEEEIQAYIDSQDSNMMKLMPRELQRAGMRVTGEANKLWPGWKASNTWENIFA